MQPLLILALKTLLGALKLFMMRAMKISLFFRSSLLGILLTALGGAMLSAAPGPLVTYKGLDDRAYISGPKLKADTFKGKVVLWEYWGINCPPCIASLPHLQEVYEKYGERGKLVVVASHFQGLSPRVKQFLDAKDYTFPVYQSARVEGIPLPKGLPFAVLIGADGRVVKSGSPGTIFDAVKKEVRKTPAKALLFPDFKAKRYKGIHSALVSGGVGLETKIKSLRSKKDEEAVELCKLFDAWAKQEIQELEALLESAPFESVAVYDSLKKSLPESVKPFAGKIESIRKDKAYSALKDLSDKTEALEERKGKGRKVSSSSVEQISEKLEPYLQDSRAHVKDAAAAIQARLKNL